MISGQVIQTSIDELRAITRIDLCVTDLDANIVASTIPEEEIQKDAVSFFVNSAADSQVVQGYHFFKILYDGAVTYILIARGNGEDAYMIGKIGVSQIQNLMIAYKERFDKNNFIQNLLLDNLLLVDMYNRAKKLHIAIEAKRVVYLIETKQEKDVNAMELIKTLFSNTRDYITEVDEKNIILVKELDKDEDYEEAQNVARMLLDMLNSEAMSQVRISYGTIINEIRSVSKSYKEAKMALDVGKIFYEEKNIISYNMLGIGRLIYQLPLPLCEMFINEVFGGQQLPDSLDEETLTTINKFFENSLNVSETSRQLYIHRNTLVYRLEKLQKSTGLDVRVFEDALTFRIALMVSNYMKYMKREEF